MKSPLERRLAMLERQNARLRSHNRRLTLAVGFAAIFGVPMMLVAGVSVVGGWDQPTPTMAQQQTEVEQLAVSEAAYLRDGTQIVDYGDFDKARPADTILTGSAR